MNKREAIAWLQDMLFDVEAENPRAVAISEVIEALKSITIVTQFSDGIEVTKIHPYIDVEIVERW